MKKCLLIASFLLSMSCEFPNNSQDIISSSSNNTELSSGSQYQKEERPSSSSRDISSSSSHTQPPQYPQKDERVVAYGWGGISSIVTDMDILKNLYKTSLSEENFDSECDYFLISVPIGEGLSYIEISKDPKSDSLLIYNIHPSLSQPATPLGWSSEWGPYCMYPQTADVLGALICDKYGGLKDRVKFPPIKYYDPTWDCWSSETNFEAVRRKLTF
jgi:hypothetical protein